MKTLNNFDIVNLCNKYNIPLNGIYRVNELIKGKSNFLTVVNSAIGNNNSGHWFGYIHNDKKKILYYIDSYGVEPFEEILSLFKGYKILYNKIQIQSLDSNICGWVVLLYALYYFNYVNKNKSIIHFYSLFTPNFINNEKIIEMIFKKLNTL
jgi:hypothetical protein